MPDISIARSMWDAAQASGASSKASLALIEAGLVESGMTNLNHGPDGSLGVLQQRPSWGTAESRMNVTESANRFLAKAKTFEPWKGTAGQLAQKVQVSGFPLKYDAVYPAAQALIAGFGTRDKVIDPAVKNVADPGGAISSLEGFFGKQHGARRLAFIVIGGGMVFIGFRLMLEVGVGQVLKVPAVKAAIKKVVPIP